MIYPKILEELIEYFKKLPGVGEKSAERLALSIVDASEDDIKNFSKTLNDAKKMLHPCEICGNLSEEKICYVCDNSYRDKNIICVVEDYKSVFALEKMGKYQGVYHILNGLISPINGVTPYDLNIDSLLKRCDGQDVEIIIALKPTIEGETTTQYLKKIIEKKNIKVTRLSYGLPVGAELDYLDSLTLERAFEDRKEV